MINKTVDCKKTMARSLQNHLDKTLMSLGITSDNTDLPSIIVAYSGGLDSTVLLHLLAQGKFKVQLTAIHINHGLMPDAEKWARFCQQTCQNLQIPIHIERVVINKQHPQGPEAAAREARYDALLKHAKAETVFLTAHHQDDQAETMLLQLFRGAGPAGLAAMPAVSAFANARLVRPLLDITRQEIQDYATREKLHWIEDQSNQDKSYSRNYLRHEVMPVIRKNWPGINQQLVRGASHQAEATELLKKLAAQDLLDCRVIIKESLNDNLLDLEKVLRLDTLNLKNMLRYYINSRDIPVPGNKQLNHIVNQLSRPSLSGQQQISWHGGELRIYRRLLSVGRPLQVIDPKTRFSWDLWSSPDEGNSRELVNQLILPGSGLALSASKGFGTGLSVARLQQGPVTVRFRQGGESCLLPGRGHHHKLKKLFQEAGIPPWERSQLPLIYVGEELAAVADKWVCTPFDARKNEAGINIRINPAPE